MPAQIPPGYTRGQIMFIGRLQDEATSAQLLQMFWTEAGAYGARILIVNAGDDEGAQRAYMAFQTWEADTVTMLSFATRRAALDGGHPETVQNATGILLCGADSLQMTRQLGGTPLAQAIRRANARNKIVGGIGPAATVLCQHMLITGDPDSGGQPYSMQFNPGLGLINRTTVTAAPAAASERDITAQLHAAVSCNPFLIGVGLQPDTAAIVYQDATLDARGRGRVLILDGVQITYNEAAADTLRAGAAVLTLAGGYRYNLDEHQVRPPRDTDIPAAENHVTSAF